MTVRELAKRAFVSPSTVSKAFNGSQEISEETRQHVFAVAKELGCFSQFCKDKRPKKVIAILCPEMGSDYYATHLEYLRTLIEGAGGICMISSFHFDEDKQQELVEYYTSYLKADGILVFNLKTAGTETETPMVALFSSQDPRVDRVTSPLTAAVQKAVDTLVDYGHRQIAFIGEPLTTNKARTVEEAVRRHPSCSLLAVESPRRFEEAGAGGVDRLLRKTNRVTAIICAYDNIAIGAIKQLRRLGYRVPQDVSVIGMDNNATGQYTETALSSVDTQPEAMCRAAWDLLQKRMARSNEGKPQEIVMPTRFILRESVGPAKEQT